jgi:hypothetical protein
MMKARQNKVSDRTEYRIPVCSGISGLGKTRMLEEGVFILQRMGLKNIFSVIVPYFNGFSPQEVEVCMPIQASFSWRLLYKFFLDGNCNSRFDHWFQYKLPRNGSLLTLSAAVAAIQEKITKTGEAGPFHLFIGIDEYQKLKRLELARKIHVLPVCESWWRLFQALFAPTSLAWLCYQCLLEQIFQ